MVFFRILHVALSVNFVGAFGAFCFCGSAGQFEKTIGFCGRCKSRVWTQKRTTRGRDCISFSLVRSTWLWVGQFVIQRNARKSNMGQNRRLNRVISAISTRNSQKGHLTTTPSYQMHRHLRCHSFDPGTCDFRG